MQFDKLKIEDILNIDESQISEDMIPIGKISKLTGVSVRSIRHYCTLGIIEPTFVDTESGYRYFAIKHITELLLIKEMRSLDFSLDDIAKIFKQQELRNNIFQNHSQSIRAEIKALEYKNSRLESMIHNFMKYSMIPENADKVCEFKITNCGKRYFLVLNKVELYVNGLAYKEAYDVLDNRLKEIGLVSMNLYAVLLDKFPEECVRQTNMCYAIMFDASELDEERIAEISKALDDDLEIVKKNSGEYLSMTFSGDYMDLLKHGYKQFNDYACSQSYSTYDDYIEIYHITRPFDKITNTLVTEIQKRLKK